MKKVSYHEYNKAHAGAAREIRPAGHGHGYGQHAGAAGIEMGVNWAAIGAVKPEEAEAFAELLTEAAKAARDFPYNGYQIDY